MYAHVNVWRLNKAGSSTDNTAAVEIGTQLSAQPGFRTYTLVRTGEREVVAITVFDTQEHLEGALDQVAGFARQRIAHLVAGQPERRAGDVLYHTAAGG